ncbi:MAG: diguanylate cyclase [Actinomycetota bacterium]|nr:diguanylate cyclase [Actinomycetota bacterium]
MQATTLGKRPVALHPGDLHVKGAKKCDLDSILCIRHKRTVKNDVAARWGGEEFVLLLQEVKGEDSIAIAEKIRGDIERLEISFGDKKIRLTASFGIAGLRDGDAEIEELIRRADRALYAAKHSGRNCVKTNF